MVNKINPVYEEKKKKRSKVKILVGILLALFILVASFLFIFHLKEVTFSGNSYYSNEELTDMLLSEGLSGNSLYVMLKYNVFSKPDIPYIQGISVRMINPGHLQIEVSEKVVAGCVDYMGTYMYFDNEGYVVDSSSTLYEGTAVISGLAFDHLVLNEKLPVKDEKIFDRILTLTGMLMRHKLNPNKIFFDYQGNVTLYFGDVRVELGDEANTKLKVADLEKILPKLSGKKGVLHMENYSADKDSVTFTAEEPSTEASSTEASSTEEPSTEP
ncbi:MAG: cell division protein FtsQ [Lachnospiraceae bacterium]|nr:cell division protein FtsQ [Lachnospiraceae bacterium]